MKKLILSVLFCLVSFYSFGYQIDENFTGQIVKKYKSGQVKSIENFKNGKLNGEFKEFFENGSLFQTGTFKNGDMKNIKVFYENGNLKFEEILKDRKNENSLFDFRDFMGIAPKNFEADIFYDEEEEISKKEEKFFKLKVTTLGKNEKYKNQIKEESITLYKCEENCKSEMFFFEKADEI